MAGVAYSQLVRPGAPAIFGAFVTSIDMTSGAPTFGTPEAALKSLYGAAQLARRLNLPFRSGGGLCGSKAPDAQAAYESSQHPDCRRCIGGGQLSRSMPPAGSKAGLCRPMRNS